MSVQDTVLSPSEEDALALVQAAIQLDSSRADPGKMAAALEKNLELWVAIRTMVSRNNSALPSEARSNLLRLSQFVADQTLRHGTEIAGDDLDSLININMQISEGLLEGCRNSAQPAA